MKKNFYEMRKQAMQLIENTVKKHKVIDRNILYLMVAEQYGITNRRFTDNYLDLKSKTGFFKTYGNVVEWKK